MIDELRNRVFVCVYVLVGNTARVNDEDLGDG